MPESLMLCLARLIRCAIVASGTRNALAISAVVSPPTARSVSAIAEDKVNAGWQHMKRRTSVSSSSDGASTVVVASCARDASTATSSSRRRRADSLRIWSVIRRKATCVSQARGLSGSPSSGHCVAAASNASCTASSAAAKSRNLRTTAPSTCGVNSLNRCSSGASNGCATTAILLTATSKPQVSKTAEHLAHLDGHASSGPSRPGRSRDARGNLIRLLRALHIDNPVAGKKLLRLRENPIRNRLPVLSGSDGLGFVGPPQTLGRDKHAGVLKLFAESAHEGDVPLQVLFRPLRVQVEISFRGIHHQNIFHVSPSSASSHVFIGSSIPDPILDVVSLRFGGMARKLPHFDRHVRGHSTGSRCRRNPAGDGVSSVRRFDIDDPVAEQVFLGLGKDAVGDGHAVLLPAHHASLVRSG